MTRQRLVWLADATHSLDSNAVLLPDRNPSDWALASHDGIRNYRPSMDVSIVDHVDRCENRDCGEQDRAFHFSGRVDFQEHWQYKYLFDLDGAAFSGRFLPFLQSHSLPIKTALFREWFDDRITAWLHFVPQDIRLHGLYSTLIYYAGLDTTRSGRPVHVDAHDAEAARIAENGREWAGRALRKEDMEIYMYRLLLEWGRLTDDRRRLIGYTV